MARGVTFDKSERALDKVLKFNEHHKTATIREPNLREQELQAKVNIEKEKLERAKKEREKEEQEDSVRFVRDNINYRRGQQ